MRSATNLERERCRITHFPQANVSACALACQITLRNRPMPQASEVLRQQPNQKFALNFAIVSHSPFSCVKRHAKRAGFAVEIFAQYRLTSEILWRSSVVWDRETELCRWKFD